MVQPLDWESARGDRRARPGIWLLLGRALDGVSRRGGRPGARRAPALSTLWHAALRRVSEVRTAAHQRCDVRLRLRPAFPATREPRPARTTRGLSRAQRPRASPRVGHTTCSLILLQDRK